MINQVRAETLTDSLERHTFEIGCYGFGSWYWGLAEAVRDVYATVFPIWSTNDRNLNFHAVDHYVRISEGSLEHAEDTDVSNCDDCNYVWDCFDVLLEEMNDNIGDGFLWHGFEGELYLSPICDVEEDIYPEECPIFDYCAYHGFN